MPVRLCGRLCTYRTYPRPLCPSLELYVQYFISLIIDDDISFQPLKEMDNPPIHLPSKCMSFISISRDVVAAVVADSMLGVRCTPEDHILLDVVSS